MAKSDREIIRTVNLNGEEFTPGQEDELEAALQAHGDANEDYDHDENLKRLTRQGAIVGFVDVDEDEIEEADLDRAATRKKNPHLLQDSKPLAKAPPAGPSSMEEVQGEPDSNVVEMHAAGGAKKHAASSEEGKAETTKLEKATETAREQVEEASIQQESDQVPAPAGAEKRTARKSAKKAKAKK